MERGSVAGVVGNTGTTGQSQHSRRSFKPDKLRGVSINIIKYNSEDMPTARPKYTRPPNPFFVSYEPHLQRTRHEDHLALRLPAPQRPQPRLVLRMLPAQLLLRDKESAREAHGPEAHVHDVHDLQRFGVRILSDVGIAAV